MKLNGHEEGIKALRALHEKDGNYLKFLVGEARTNTDHKAEFRAEDGTLYELRVDIRTGDLVVELAVEQRPSRIPPSA